MKYWFKYIAAIFLITLVVACKKPYNPPAISAAGSYLVVAGIINSGSDSTTITLSRTVSLSSKVTTNPVFNAIVAVQSDQNVTYPLTETTNGNYVCAGLNLNSVNKYRLSIKTNNEQYYSDYVAVLNSPPIDSVYYTTTNSGLNIYSATHDPTNTVKYYRWDYQETWIIHSYYYSFFKSNGDTVLARDLNNDEIGTCWRSDTSSTIVLGATADLAKDVVSANPITSIASTSEKITSEYSIIVKQYALTGDAYSFWTNLKKNTEQLGSIFDAEPSQINGNIHSATNAAEPVVGYISCGNTSSIRIFINNQNLPAWSAQPYYVACQLDTFLYKYVTPGSKTIVNQVDEFINYDKGGAINLEIPVDAIGLPGMPPIGYTASSRECVDCTLRGTNKQPSFWK